MTVRSAVTSARVPPSSSIRRRSASAAGASSRHSTPTAPCPGAGTQADTGSASEMRSPKPTRSSPAHASTIASYWPSSTLRRRVSTLPRMGSKVAPGSRRWSWVMRRMLLVPRHGVEPRMADTASIVRGTPACRAGSTSASHGVARGRNAAMTSPGGSTTGRSLVLCTARSIDPASSASSISLTNRRLPAPSSGVVSASGAALARSPDVRMTTISLGSPRASSRRATSRACHNANVLPRVPIRSGLASALTTRRTPAARRRPGACPAPRRLRSRGDRRARTGG